MVPVPVLVLVPVPVLVPVLAPVLEQEPVPAGNMRQQVARLIMPVPELPPLVV